MLTTWTMSYEQVQKQSEEAACLLKLWGFLDNRDLWYGLIAADVDLAAGMEVPAWLLKIAEDELLFADAMGLLSSYSLVEGKEGMDSYSMHPVLHRWCGYLAGDEEQQELGCLSVELVASSVPSKLEVEFWRKRKRIMAHALCVNEWIVSADRSGEEGSVEGLIQPGSFHNLGYLFDDENRQRAEQMYQRALAGKEKAWGPDHASTLDTINNLGILYVDLGRLEQAEHMYQRALAGQEKAWGPDHASTLDTVNNLGNLYLNIGKLKETEQMYQRALAGKEKAWGLDHISTLATANNLGLLYAALGRFEQAEHMYQRALAGREKILGLNHASTLNTVNNLGTLYADLGKLEQAEQMYQRALAGYRKAVHPDNLLTFIPALNTMWRLASLRKNQGRVEDARHWYSQALLGYEKTFGQEHNKCGALRDNLEALVIEEEEEEEEEERGGRGGGSGPSTNRMLSVDYTSTQNEASPGISIAKPASRRNRLLRKLEWK